MNAWKKILLGGLGVLVVVALLVYSRDPSPNPNPSASLHGSRVDSRSTVESLDARLSGARLSALERRLQELEHELPVSKEQPDVTGPPEPDQRTDQGVPEPPAHDPAFLKRIVADREEALRSEPLDPAWSGSTEAQIARTFREGTFGGSSIQRTQCGSSFCVLVVRHEDVAARLDFERFATAFPGMGIEFVFQHGADGKPETTAFFIRPGNDSPDHPARIF